MAIIRVNIFGRDLHDRLVVKLLIGGIFFIILLVTTSFSTAMPVGRTVERMFMGNGLSSSGNGTVTISVHRGFNPSGLFSRIGYTISLDNRKGSKTVEFHVNVTYHYLSRNPGLNINTSLPDIIEYHYSVLSIPFPIYPFKITFSIMTNTSTNLSLSRTGIVLFNCYIVFIEGNETVTGPS